MSRATILAHVDQRAEDLTWDTHFFGMVSIDDLQFAHILINVPNVTDIANIQSDI